MMGDYHVWFCEGLRVKLPLPTRLANVSTYKQHNKTRNMKEILSLLLLFNMHLVMATNLPGGMVNGNWSLENSPYTVEGNITVDAGTTLTIEAGVEVIFTGEYYLEVNGCIQANGNTDAPIQFTSASEATYWKGIRIEGTENEGNSYFHFCTFTNGVQTDTYQSGGAIKANNANDLEISNCDFINNSAYDGGAIYSSNSRMIIIENCSFRNNTSTATSFDHGGGAICLLRGKGIVRNNRIINNYAGSMGGGIHVQNGQFEVLGNLIANNKCIQRGGGVSSWTSSLHLINNTIVNNSADGSGDGIYTYGTKLMAYNCIIRFNEGNADYNIDSFNELNYCNVNYIASGNENTTTDPEFVNPNTIIGNSTTEEELNIIINSDWSLLATSPLIDKGTDMGFDYMHMLGQDIKGNTRVYGGYSDIGAYENIDIVYNATLSGTIVESDGTTPIKDAWIGGVYTNENGQFELNLNNGYNGDLRPRHPYYVFEKQTTGPVSGSITMNFQAKTARTIDEGNYSGILTKEMSPYILTGSITIPDGQELSIEPGVELIAMGNYGIKVLGSIVAIGTETDSIYFGHDGSIECWDGLRLDNTNGQMNDNSPNNFGFCKISNAANYKGAGALYLYNVSDAVIADCYFTNNYGYNYGGGIYSNYGTNFFYRNTLYANFASSGGGIAIAFGNSEVTHNLFLNNINSGRYTNSGGGGLYYNNSDNASIHSNLFINNNGQAGGALLVDQCTSGNIYNNYMVNNSGLYGGAIYTRSAENVNIYQNVIANNSCKIGWGGAFYTLSSIINLNNNTLVGNYASQNSNCLYARDCTINFTNCIINNLGSSDKTEQFYPKTTTLNIDYSVLDSDEGTTNCLKEEVSFYQTAENISNYLNQQQMIAILDSAWMPDANSVCINAGIEDISNLVLSESDITGADRIIEDRIDMGAYECYRYLYSGIVHNTAEATVSWNNHSISTDNEGNFSFYVLKDESITVSAEQDNRSFEPAQYKFDNATSSQVMSFVGDKATTRIELKELDNLSLVVLSSDELLVKAQGIYKLDIYTVNGSKVLSNNINNDTIISISNLSSGLFIAVISGNSLSKSTKFVK